MKVVSLFSGCGGLDLGFKKAGFSIIWANDFDKDSVETYKKNIGDEIVFGDITTIDKSTIPDNVDVVLGGFPCQGFSVANTKRSMKDDRNFLYKELLSVVKNKKPKFFVGENVKGLVSMQKGGVIKTIIEDFKKIGYKVDYKILKASDYGVPQHRERVIILGNNIGVENVFPTVTHGDVDDLIPYISTEQAISHLSKVHVRDNSFKLKNELIFNHIARTNVSDKFWGRKYKVNQEEICDYLKFWRDRSTYSTKSIDAYFGYKHTAGHWFRKDNKSGSIPNPEDWWNLKKLLNFDDKFDKVVTTMVLKEIKFEQSLRISNWDEPSDTITATGPEIHPNKKRRLSVRECAILQTFPNDFIFHGSLNSMYKQIGNAVPPKLSFAIANEIKKNFYA